MTTKQKIDPYLSLMEIPPYHINIIVYIDCSEVNDPGSRAVFRLSRSQKLLI